MDELRKMIEIGGKIWYIESSKTYIRTIGYFREVFS